MTNNCEAVYIPPSVVAMSLHELADRLAATIHDPSGTDAEWSHHSDLAKVLKADFMRAGGAGQLVIRHPVAHVPVQPDTQGAVVLVDDAARYLAESGSRFRITRHAEALPFVGLHPLHPVPWADVPHLVASAMHPETDDSEELQGYGIAHLVTKRRLESAAMFGELVARDPLTRQPVQTPISNAVALAGDLCAFFTGSHTEKPPAPLTTQPAPQAAVGRKDPHAPWTLEELDALWQVRRDKGTSEAAKAFGISDGLVRQKLPGGRNSPKPSEQAKQANTRPKKAKGTAIWDVWKP